jgi:hypothetical protein
MKIQSLLVVGGALSLSLPLMFTTSCVKTITLYNVKDGTNLRGKTLSFPVRESSEMKSNDLCEETISFKNGYSLLFYNTGTGTGIIDCDFFLYYNNTPQTCFYSAENMK